LCPEQRRPFTHTMVIGLLAAFLLSSLAIGPSLSKEEEILKKYKLFSDVVGKIENHYVNEVDEEKLFYSALDGMVRSLDQHSQFLAPELYEELRISTTGEFGGLGIQISIRDGILTIISPIEGTPADEAGLRPGDRIIEIEGQTTKDVTLEEAVKRLRGPKGAEVTIRIWRALKGGTSETRLVTIVRDIIHVKSVKWQMMSEGIAYLRLNEFQGDSGDELRRALKSAKAEGAKGMILDLRRNPGGLLSAAIDVAELFVPKGELIVYTLGRDEDQSRRYVAQARKREWDGPLVVLIDAGSASASEIVAGAVRDLEVGILVGTHSFGKASVQNVYELPDNSALKLTTAYYYTSSGTQIDGKGIAPHRVVEPEYLEEEDPGREENEMLRDPQVAAAMDVLKGQLLLHESGLVG